MPSITPYGGVDEIGGNKIVLSSKEGRYLLDFGLSFKRYKELFSEFMQPRVANVVGDYLASGLAPKLKGLYRMDLLEPTNLMEYSSPTFDGVLLSHAHLDHCGLVSLIDWKIPTYCSRTTEKIMDVLTRIKHGMERELTIIKKRPYGEYMSSYPEAPRQFKRFDSVPKIDVESYPVDHSTWGARGLILHMEGKTLAYTGDLRLHGPRSNMTEDFIEQLEDERIDLLLVEGTRVGNLKEERVRMLTGELRKKLESEDEVKEKSIELIEDHDGAAFLDFAKRDFDRFLTFYEVAREVGRKLVIPFDFAYQLDSITERPGMDSQARDLIVYFRRKRLSAYDEREYYEWERGYLERENTRKPLWIKKHMDDLLIYADYWHLQELIDLEPGGGLYIHSSSEPFDEESAIDFQKFKKWLEMYDLNYEYLHASGHLSEKETFELCRKANPYKIVPIHTRGSKVFESNLNGVIVPKEGKEITF